MTDRLTASAAIFWSQWKAVCLSLAFLSLPLFFPHLLKFSALSVAVLLCLSVLVEIAARILKVPRARLVFILGSCLVIGFFCFCAITSVKDPALLTKNPYGYYNLLTDGLLNGQLSLLEKSSQPLESFLDPNWWGNRGQVDNLMDSSLYLGKHYIYWGISPVLTFFLPIKMWTGLYASEWFGCYFYASFAFLACALFVRLFLRRRFNYELDSVDTVLLLFCLGFSSTLPYILRRPNIYEIAILAGTAFFMLSLYFLEKALQNETANSSKFYLVVSGITYALAVGSRPPYVFACLPLFLLIFRSFSSTERGKSMSHLASFCLPIFLYGSLLALYNYLRFDSIWEFGLKYQIANYPSLHLLADLSEISRSFRAYLINRPALLVNFPFFKVTYVRDLIGGHRTMNDPVVGIFAIAPISLFGLILIPRHTSFQLPRYLKMWMILVYLSAFALLVIDSYMGINERYTGDIGLLLQVVPLLVFFSGTRDKTLGARLLYLLGALLIIAGFAIAFFISFTGVEGRLYVYFADIYRAAARIFGY